METNHSGKKILVIDDEPDFLCLIEARLKKENLQVITAEMGKVGLEKIKTDHPDLILLDLMMPQIDGFAVLGILKTNPQTRKIPVIILSARNTPENVNRSVRLGAHAFIAKDSGFDYLISIIKDILANPDRKQELSA